MTQLEQANLKRHALRWLSQALAWEERLNQLRGDALVDDERPRAAA